MHPASPMQKKRRAPLSRPTSPRAPVAASSAAPPAYAAWTLTRLRSLGLAAAFLAPLGALAGTVAACGGAAPVQRPLPGPTTAGVQDSPPSAAGPVGAPSGSTSTTPERPSPSPAQGPVPIAM